MRHVRLIHDLDTGVCSIAISCEVLDAMTRYCDNALQCDMTLLGEAVSPIWGVSVPEKYEDLLGEDFRIKSLFNHTTPSAAVRKAQRVREILTVWLPDEERRAENLTLPRRIEVNF